MKRESCNYEIKNVPGFPDTLKKKFQTLHPRTNIKYFRCNKYLLKMIDKTWILHFPEELDSFFD